MSSERPILERPILERPILERPTLPTARLRALAGLLDPLTARVREAELRALPAAIDPGQPAAGLEALLAHLGEARARLAAAEARLESIQLAALQLAEEQRAAFVVEKLREAGAGRSALRAASRGRLDLPCLLEREGARVEEIGVELELCLRLLPGLALGPDEATTHRLLARSRGLDHPLALAASGARRPTRLAALRAIEGLLAAGAVPWTARPAVIELLDGLCADSAEDIWVRRAALRGVAHLAPSTVEPILERCLSSQAATPAEGDGALLRALALRLALARPERPAEPLVERFAQDPSESVRFALAEGLAARHAGSLPAIRALVRRAETRTRARLAWELAAQGGEALALVAGFFADEELVARSAIDGAIAALRRGEPVPQGLAEASLPQESIPLRRRAALLRALIEQRANPAAELARRLAELPRGGSERVRLPPEASPMDLAQALVPWADEGHGFSIEPYGPAEARGARIRVHRGDKPASRLWRTLDELRNRSPAKRQAHIHSTGRANLGPIRVPPIRLAEATPTGVPDQRVVLERQESWAPEQPMVDDLDHALDHGELRIVSPLGTTRLQAPRRAGLLSARLKLLWNFRRYSRMRNAALDTVDPAIAEAWEAEVHRLGFQVEHSPRLNRAWIDPVAFSLSMAGSSLDHLLIVLGLLGVGLLGRLTWARQQLRRARASIPLVLGGWGTRGKSGTERLKAGLLEAMNIPFLSKTTGCEAMVLHAPPGGRARELFLYRPYDKATIWEQAEVTTLAPRLGARVLLWECMALNPRYVELLQSWWVQDDISTLTNAFPDHEDIQGPTGLDVAEVISGFSPPGRTVLTTEEEMLPVMREVARERDCRVQPVPRAHHELMPRDLLARFRHSEHPANVALVASLARELEIPWEEAVGWMAERVVADVGALVLHAPVRTEGRRITFAQGQSANDPLSFRHSWRTAGFEQPCPVGEWRVSVVNNRADRVARSRMFAGLLADQASAHRHVLIGTNLQGLRSYLDEAVVARLARTDLRSTEATERLFAHLRLPEPAALASVLGERLGISDLARVFSPLSAPVATLGQARELARRVEPALRAATSGLPAETASQLQEHLVEAAARHLALRQALAGSAELRASLYRELVEASLVVVEDPKTSGDRIIDRVARCAPPGAEIRLIGLQNIKGTGLDFAYRWVEWGQVSAMLARLGRASVDDRGPLLGELVSREYGSVMACDGVLEALEGLEGAEVEGARARLLARRAALVAARGVTSKGGAWRGALSNLERALDPLHGVLRRARGRRILGELAAMEISHDRAQRELRALVDGQKGGWLVGR